MRGACHKGTAERVIQVNRNLESRDLLPSQAGLRRRSAPLAKVEQTFANLKSNKGFCRFLCRGLDKVATEFALMVLSHNFAKMATVRT